jgi:hypothetical protein
MTITTTGIARAAGLCAAAAGAIFIGVQIHHPPADVAHVVTTDMAVRETAKAVMAVLALVGFTGMFVWQRRRLGALGLAGYLLLSVGFLSLFAIECIVGYVLPTVARSDPQYVQHVLNAAVGSGPSSGIGHMQQLFLLSGIGYPLGGLLFGIALFRAGQLARWAAALFAVATTSVVALAALPESYNRPFAVPAGVALIGLGISLWRNSRGNAFRPEPAALRVEPVAV